MTIPSVKRKEHPLLEQAINDSPTIVKHLEKEKDTNPQDDKEEQKYGLLNEQSRKYGYQNAKKLDNDDEIAFFDCNDIDFEIIKRCLLL